MTLKFIEGFDRYGDTSKITDGNKWTDSTNMVSDTSLIAGRITGNALRMSEDSSLVLRKAFGTNYTSGVFGFAFRLSDYPTTFNPYSNFGPIQIGENGSGQIGIAVNTAGQLEVIRSPFSGGATSLYTVLARSSQSLIKNSWHYIELKFVIADTGGSVIIHVDEVEWINYSGDTNRTGNNYITEFRLRNSQLSGVPSYDFDDFYFCDLAGTVNDDFLGDMRIVTLAPSGAGTYTDFTPVGETNNHDCVDDATINDDVDYVESDTVGHQDSYAFDNLPAAGIGTIAGIQICSRARKDDANPRHIKNLVISGATEQLQDDHQLATIYASQVDVLEEDPNTSSAWTKTTVDAAEFGFEVTT